METALLLGFLLGLQHALEADHVAAVTSIASRESSVRGMVRHGAVWGLGHALSLAAFSGVVIALGRSIDGRAAAGLEALTGVLLVGLGCAVLVRLRRRRVHFHAHEHRDGTAHFHAHAHVSEGAHDATAHEHGHAGGLPLATFLVGGVHGLAGSAAVIVLATASATTFAAAVSLVALFGLGSILGMATLSAVIAVPLRYTARSLGWFHGASHALLGVATIAIGLAVLHDSAGVVWPLG
jgi:hypothetical protein